MVCIVGYFVLDEPMCKFGFKQMSEMMITAVAANRYTLTRRVNGGVRGNASN